MSAPEIAGGDTVAVEVVAAWPRRHVAVGLRLPRGATVADAVAAAAIDAGVVDGYAVFGERVAATALLADGDRVELLRPLLADPKEVRRRRARRPPGR